MSSPRAKTIRTIILVVLFACIPVFLSWVAYTSRQSTSLQRQEQSSVSNSSGEVSSKSRFPKEIAGMQQISYKEGEEALEEVFQLHQKELPLKNAYILVYSNLTYEAKIWVSESNKAEEAAELTTQMTQKLQNSPIFSSPQTLMVGDKTLYATWGENNRNYYWQAGKLVIWVATNLPAEQIDSFLKAAVQGIK